MTHHSLCRMLAGLALLFLPPAALADVPSPAHDDSFRAAVIGTWVQESAGAYHELRVSEDGTLTGSGHRNHQGKREEYRFNGFWEIVNGFWVDTTTESSLPEMVGITSIDTILSIDAGEMVLLTQEGETLHLRRKPGTLSHAPRQQPFAGESASDAS